MDRRLKHTDAASTYHHHHVQPTADDAYDAVGERAPRPRARVTLPAALMASMLLIASLAAGACCTTGAWAVEPAGPGQTTGDADASSQPGDGGQGTGSSQNGPTGGDAGSQTGGSGNAGSDGNVGSGSAGAGEPTAPAPTPAPAPSQPTWTVHKIYLNWGPVLGYAADSVDVPAGSVTQAVEGRAVEGYKFDGWAYDADCTVPFDWSAPVYSDQSAWACYEKTSPAYSASDLSGVTVDVDGVKRAISPGTTTTVSHDARISLDGVPSGWTVTKTTGADGVEEITVTSPDGKTAATWSFRRKPAVGSADNRSGSGSGMEPRGKAKAAGKHGGAHAGVEEPALLTARRPAGGRLSFSPRTIALAVVAVVGAAVVAACLARLRRLDAMETGSEAGDSADGTTLMESGEEPYESAGGASTGDGAWDSSGSQTPSSEAPTQLMRPAAMPLTMDSGEAPELADLVRRTTGGLGLEAAHGDVGLDARTEPSTVVSPQETLDHRL